MEVDKNYQPSKPHAPSKLHPHSEDAYDLSAFKPSNRGRINIWDKLLVYLFTVFVALCAVLLVFSLIVLRPNSPTFRIADVSVKDLEYGVGGSPFLNGTVLAGLMLKNTNFGRFVFEGNGSTLGLAFNEALLGERAIGGGSVAARRTRRIEVELALGYNVSGGSSPAAGNLSQGIDAGLLEMRVIGRIGGKVHLLKYVKKSLSSVLNCTLSLDLGTRSFKGLHCE